MIRNLNKSYLLSVYVFLYGMILLDLYSNWVQYIPFLIKKKLLYLKLLKNKLVGLKYNN